jgi:photosystem II stability/assembly factor-like uncharacterized protein
MTGPREQIALVKNAGEIRQSHDGGITWSDVPTDLPPGQWSLVADPSQQLSAYASTNGQTWAYHTTDDGLHWAPVTVPASITDPYYETRELADPARPGTIVFAQSGHVFTSHDAGATWVRSPRALPFNPTGFDHDGDLYALSSAPLRSADDGMTWTWRPTGAAGAEVYGVTADATTGAVYAESTGGLLRLDASGARWRSVSPAGGSQNWFDDRNASGLTAGSGTLLLDSANLRSTDGGRSFAAFAGPFDPEGAGGLLVHVGTGETFVGYGGGSANGPIHVSTDGGVTWTGHPEAPVAPTGRNEPGPWLAVLQSTSAWALIESDDAGNVFRSDDAGASWRAWRQVGGSHVIAATGSATYLVPSDSTAPGLWVLPAGSADPRPTGSLGDTVVQTVVTSARYPRLAVALGSANTESATLRAYVTRDAGRTWMRLRPPVPAKQCVPQSEAITRDGRLVLVLGERQLDADLAPPSCGVVSVLSSRLDG